MSDESSELKRQDSSISLGDIEACLSVIELASNRGAIKPNEMGAIGNLYTRLDNFVKNATKMANERNTQMQENDTEEQ